MSLIWGLSSMCSCLIIGIVNLDHLVTKMVPAMFFTVKLFFPLCKYNFINIWKASIQGYANLLFLPILSLILAFIG